MTVKNLILPWPAHELSPNARVHFQVKAQYAKNARFEGRLIALSEKFKLPASVPLQMTVVIRPPTRRHYDMDNILASCKPAIDGIMSVTDADDKQIKRVIMDMEDPWVGGRIEMTIEEMA